MKIIEGSDFMSISMLDNISYKGRKPDNVRSQFNTIA